MLLAKLPSSSQEQPPHLLQESGLQPKSLSPILGDWIEMVLWHTVGRRTRMKHAFEMCIIFFILLSTIWLLSWTTCRMLANWASNSPLFGKARRETNQGSKCQNCNQTTSLHHSVLLGSEEKLLDFLSVPFFKCPFLHTGY